MRLQQAAELAQERRRWWVGSRELAGPVTDPHVVGQDLGDQGVLGIDDAGAAGKQDVLLLMEVVAAARVPVGEEGASGLGRAVGVGALEALGDHQRVVVVAGQLLKCGVAPQPAGVCPVWSLLGAIRPKVTMRAGDGPRQPGGLEPRHHQLDPDAVAVDGVARSHLTAMRLDDRAHDRQPKPGASGRTRA